MRVSQASTQGGNAGKVETPLRPRKQHSDSNGRCVRYRYELDKSGDSRFGCSGRR